jgi:hypothetical protein
MQMKRQMHHELEAEKKLKANVERELRDVEQEIAKLKVPSLCRLTKLFAAPRTQPLTATQSLLA